VEFVNKFVEMENYIEWRVMMEIPLMEMVAHQNVWFNQNILV